MNNKRLYIRHWSALRVLNPVAGMERGGLLLKLLQDMSVILSQRFCDIERGEPDSVIRMMFPSCV
jgi:hypothetical protein